MRLCLIGGVIILLVIIIGIIPSIVGTDWVQSPLWSRRRRTDLVSFIWWISVSLYAICAGYLLFRLARCWRG